MTSSRHLDTADVCSISRRVIKKVKQRNYSHGVTWYYSEDPVTVVEEGLLIKQLSDRSNGTFTCRAVVPETGEVQEKQINLIVSCSSDPDNSLEIDIKVTPAPLACPKVLYDACKCSVGSGDSWLSLHCTVDTDVTDETLKRLLRSLSRRHPTDLTINMNQNVWKANLQFDNFGLLVLKKLRIHNMKQFVAHIIAGAFTKSEEKLEEIVVESGAAPGKGWVRTGALSDLNKLAAVRLGSGGAGYSLGNSLEYRQQLQHSGRRFC